MKVTSSVAHKFDINRELQKAVQLHQSGQLDQAGSIYSKILESVPGHADALHLFGLVHCERNEFTKARDFIRRAIQADEGEPVFRVSLGDVLQRQGQHSRAVACYLHALELNPDSIEALCNMGNALREMECHRQAIACYKQVVEINPDLPALYNNMGLAYQKLQEYADAESCFKKAIAINSVSVDAHSNLATLYRELSKFDAAVEHYKQALALAPANTSIHYNLGVLYQTRHMTEPAVYHYRQAVAHQPPVADAHSNLGKYYQDQNRPGQAMHHFEKAIELDSAHFDAQFNRALSLLATGRFREGWAAYEWRFKRDEWKRVYPHQLSGPRWDGQDFSGKTLFIHSEQGFGDTIWFARYLPLVKALGGEVIFETRDELIDLLQNISGVDRLVPMSFRHPPQISYDLHVPLMSLPAVLGTTMDTIPGNIPYISASEKKSAYWADTIRGDKFNIGLVWAAKSTTENERSCPLAEFLPLFKFHDTQFYGLQKGEDEYQAEHFMAEVISIGPEFDSFADTAGVIQNLDLVISVDTAVAHLAGAMAKPVWVVLPWAADWKWFLDRKDSPWYPTMRLFRQPRPGDWASVVNMVASELRQWMGERTKSDL